MGTVPSALLPNAFMAHAHDLQDPWSSNSGACEKQPLPRYDCHTPWFMGAGIHPRLKKPASGAAQLAAWPRSAAWRGVASARARG